MNDDKQPEDLRLADVLNNNMLVYGLRGREAAAELRRLHAENAELLDALKDIKERCMTSFSRLR
jgi:hypothetical protein